MSRILIAVLVIGLAVLVGCGDDDDNSTSPEPNYNRIYDSLLFTREVGSIMSTGASLFVIAARKK